MLFSVGRINLCSPDHISLLVHRTFNASIPRHHIPVDEWKFEYDPPENDPEFDELEAGQEDMGENGLQKDELESGGHWVHKVTGDKLGGTEGYLEFTVIG
jgi:DNA-directed RNA polymerase I subunit RPA43